MQHPAVFPNSVSAFTAPCPACGQATLSVSPTHITMLAEISEQAEVLLETLTAAAAYADRNGHAGYHTIADAFSEDDPNGGPEPARMYADIAQAAEEINVAANAMGVSVVRQAGWGYRLQLRPSMGLTIKPSVSKPRFKPVKCYCCRQQVRDPSLEMVMAAFNLQPKQRAVLRLIDASRNDPLDTDAVVMHMERFGERARTRKELYSAFKVAVSYARAALRGSGISILNIGYDLGYRIVGEVRA